ncbi:B box and SPRY domain-containing protein [Leucoraja erinacea]|uniref:B box and SPRY domain-containing protein n=1 Tax=Leucoraja erinaceus TaxID=7782 RepID=UPI0024576E7A|nr:B box and SPRY domain-containing protein [Leucoraja erinacea]
MSEPGPAAPACPAAGAENGVRDAAASGARPVHGALAGSEQLGTGTGTGQAAERMRNKLVDVCEKLQLRIASVTRFEADTLNSKDHNVKAKASESRELIIHRVNFIREVCENEEQRLLDIIHDEEERVQQSVLTQKTYWAEAHHKLTDIKMYLVDMLTKMDDVALMEQQKEILEKAEEAEGILEPKDSNKLNFNLACGRSNLLSSLWVSATMLCMAGAEDVHVDEKTLHPSLVLSENKKRLTYASKRVHLYPDGPERFDHWPNALGLESFQSGLHTWRVDVERSCAYKVGLASDCLARKGAGNDCRLGYNPSSWVFSRYDGEYTVAHDGQVKSLDLLRRPTAIGVLVDYDGGEILFYDPDTCAILQSYRTKFTHPIHAALGVVDESISII